MVALGQGHGPARSAPSSRGPACRPSQPLSALRPEALECRMERGHWRESFTESQKNAGEEASISRKIEACSFLISNQAEETEGAAVIKRPKLQNHC